MKTPCLHYVIKWLLKNYIFSFSVCHLSLFIYRVLSVSHAMQFKGQLVKRLVLASPNRQKFHKAVSYESVEMVMIVGSSCMNLECILPT